MATVTGNRVTLSPRELPSRWYNLAADLPFAIPPMMSKSGYRITRNELAPLFPTKILDQELNGSTRFFSIPGDVKDLYRQWRPTPLFRAHRLEEELGTPARLYYKFEGGSPCGSYESNTALPQAHFARESGAKWIVTGGAGGVWVRAIGHAAGFTGLKAKVYSVRDPRTGAGFGDAAARVWDVEIVASPSEQTEAGRHYIERHGSERGTIAVALAEAYEEATRRDEVKFAMPTLLNHTVIHNSVIGLEAERQMRAVREYPDMVIGAIGGGAHYAGLISPYVKARAHKETETRFIAVEDASTPSLTRGRYGYDTPDAEGLMPAVQMYTVGRDYVPPGIFAGAMRYHGVSPILSSLHREKVMEAVAHGQVESYSAGLMFTRSEGIMLSPASMYTVKEVVDRALECRESGKDATILFSVAPAAEADRTPFDSLLDGRMEDPVPPDENMLERSIGRLLGR